MRWSYRVARIADIDIKIHVTFLLILLLGGMEWGADHGVSGFAFGVVLMLALFLCVVLHELGHSLAAKGYGIPVREIVLLPIGGVAMLGRLPDRPRQELWVAAAGPLVNVVIAGVLYVVLGLAPGLAPLDGRGLLDGTIPPPSVGLLLQWLLAANVTLVLFNLIPAFPLDGGRMLRAGLAMVTDYARATRTAAAIGQVAAIGLGVLGIMSGNFILALIAVFIFFGAGMESFQAQARTVLTTLRIGDAYNKYALTLSPGDRVSRVVDFILTSYQPDFAVVLGDRLLGVVTRDDVRRALSSRSDDPYVAEIMEREIARVEAHASLEEVQGRLAETGARIAAVYAGDRYLGLVSREDLAEALSVLMFTRRQREAARPATAA
jgi:Zn-dependent protease/predicted transcriptional regulator